MCAVCKVPEDTEHFLFHCDAYKEERDCLEKSVEGVLYAEGIFTVCDINLKVLNGCISDISRQGRSSCTVCEEHQTFFSKCNDRLRMRMEHMC